MNLGEKNLEEEIVQQYRDGHEEVFGIATNMLKQSKEPAITGIIVLFPLVVIYYVLYWFIDKIKAMPYSELMNLTPYVIVNDAFKLVFGLIGIIIVLTGLGRFVETGVGSKVERGFDGLFERIPLISSIYGITKISVDTLLTGPGDFQTPVKVDLGPLRLTGFKTGNKADRRDIVFMPTAPNITTGFVVELDEESYNQSEETVEEALSRILSAGFGHSDGDRDNIREDSRNEE